MNDLHMGHQATSVKTQELAGSLDEMSHIYRGSAIFEDRYAPEVTTLFSAVTYIFQSAATNNPLMLVTAEDWGGGKTLHLLNTAAAVRNPLIVTDPNRAQLYRLGNNHAPAKKPTFIIDEGDQGFFGKEGVTALVNASWTPETANTYRSNTDPGKNNAQEKYSLWHPYIVGMIGAPPNHSTLSRCIVVRLRKSDTEELDRAGIDLSPKAKERARARLGQLGALVGELLTEHVRELKYAWPARRGSLGSWSWRSSPAVVRQDNARSMAAQPQVTSGRGRVSRRARRAIGGYHP